MTTSQRSQVMVSMDKVARSLAAHRADYPEAREAIDSLAEDIADLLTALEAPAREAFEAAAREPQDEAAPVPGEVTGLITQARDAMGGAGSNDEEHEALLALTGYLAGLYGIAEAV